jgi:signal transduction histidine kinase
MDMTALTIQPADTGSLGIDDFKELMRSVHATTERLQQTHAALQRQVGQLQAELAEARGQLQRSRDLAALGEMAAGIAHEVRNPLGSIQLYVQMLADDLSDLPEQAALCRKIGCAVHGLDAVVRDVLQFARDTVIRPAPVTADHLFDRAVACSESLIGQSEVAVERQLEPQCELEGDERLLTQALANLIRNAVEAMREAGEGPHRLTLSAGRLRVTGSDGRRALRVVLAVADTGPGIPGEARQRMFNPFFTTRATGTGLGLAIVHRIVDAHGGQVQVDDLRPRGARIALSLPPTQATASEDRSP